MALMLENVLPNACATVEDAHCLHAKYKRSILIEGFRFADIDWSAFVPQWTPRKRKAPAEPGLFTRLCRRDY
jgi:hypothetical protein